MEQVLTSQGALMLGLVTWCGGVEGIRTGFYVLALLAATGEASLIALWMWENPEHAQATRHRPGERTVWSTWLEGLLRPGFRLRQ